MITRDQIVEEARTWIGTPFHHQGRLKGVGVDCIGLIFCVVKSLGYDVEDHPGYSHQPDGILLRRSLEEHCDLVPLDDSLPGDILLFRFNHQPQHVAFKTDLGLIHSISKRVCCEHAFDGIWRSRFVAAFHIKGVE